MKAYQTVSSVVAMLALAPQVAAAAEAADQARDTGVSAMWLLANFSYAGMRAQNHPSQGWRVLSFIFGFPGTLLSFLVVPEGEERAYGVEISRRR